MQEHGQGETQKAGVTCSLHQLRHSHATELINGGVSLTTIHKRLGHQHLQTPLRYAEISDATADTEPGGAVAPDSFATPPITPRHRFTRA